MSKVCYDDTGKVNLNGIYNRSDPIAYFSTLSQLDYQIPQKARPAFRRLIAARREVREVRPLRVLDLGCSYGVNGAVLKYGLSMPELYRLYGADAGTAQDALLDRDRGLYHEPDDPDLEMVGLDVAERAVEYAVEAGSLDAGVAADLEARAPTTDEAAVLGNADLIISTGCFGYVTDTSLRRVLEASNGSRPWMAHFVLRMFPFDEAREMMAGQGYVTEKVEGLHAQRRFASDEEQAHALDNLAQLGIDPTGAEAEGWYFAELHVARPAEDERSLPLDRILPAS